jgi:4-hydroxy-tetrahydrodipicolinate synthase
LPIVTPFTDGAVDLVSYERMLRHYVDRGVTGVFPIGTTGESPTLDDDEVEALVDCTVTVVAGRVPVFVGIGGNATAKVIESIRRREHFTRIAESTAKQIVSYNIPYRTGVNLKNETLRQLAEASSCACARRASR